MAASPTGSAEVKYPTYEEIGVRPLINCWGTHTIISGSLILPEVRAAMSAASKQYVHMEELMDRVGARIAELMQVEWALVTNGCAAGLCQVTAACVAGVDGHRISRLPDTSGMKNEVIAQSSHHHVYEHAVRMVGVKMIDVNSTAELEAAEGERTALLLIFGDAVDRGEISVAEMVRVGREHGVPSLVDAAAERPDVPNRYLAEGVDAVAYSGGKCLRGPQASGLVLGKKSLLQAAFMNGAPHHGLGRPMKAGKEEIMGLLAAVEQWVVRDHDAEWSEWERRMRVIADAVTPFESVTTSISQPGRSNVAPVLAIEWNAASLGHSAEEVRHALLEGTPRIFASASQTGITVNPCTMEDGEDEIVARRLSGILSAST